MRNAMFHGLRVQVVLTDGQMMTAACEHADDVTFLSVPHFAVSCQLDLIQHALTRTESCTRSKQPP